MALIYLILIVSILIGLVFAGFLFTGKIYVNRTVWAFFQIWGVVAVPFIYLLFMDIDHVNDCCSDSAVFSPDHRASIYMVIILCMSAYVVNIFKKAVFPPLLEVLINSFLILGIIINALLWWHLENPVIWAMGSLPVILLFIIELVNNHRLLNDYINENELKSGGILGKISTLILTLNPLLKYPILTVLLVPILILTTLFLLIFGQKPDSLIRSFTDTYRHGFSQLDYMCANVTCGGHFLCSVGANGHKNVVKPIRYGTRHGNKIICNRQLLVSNAFEELIQEKTPRLHKFIRGQYNKVGNAIHKHYHIFNIKWVSDVVYILMKPLELTFLLTLYLFDKKPENRIAAQYLSMSDREQILNSK